MERPDVKRTCSSIITRIVVLAQACLLLRNVLKTLNYFVKITALFMKCCPVCMWSRRVESPSQVSPINVLHGEEA